jgi:hypothetical protein
MIIQRFGILQFAVGFPADMGGPNGERFDQPSTKPSTRQRFRNCRFE